MGRVHRSLLGGVAGVGRGAWHGRCRARCRWAGWLRWRAGGRRAGPAAGAGAREWPGRGAAVWARAGGGGGGGQGGGGAGVGAGRAWAVTPCLVGAGRPGGRLARLPGLRAAQGGAVGAPVGVDWRAGWNRRGPVVELEEPAAGGGGR